MREKRINDQDSGEIDLLELFQVFAQRWKLILTSGAAAALLAFLFTAQFITPMYRASVTVYVNNINANETIEYVSAGNLATAQQLVNTYVNMIRSNTVLDKVAESAGLEYTAGDIRRMMTAVQVDETELFEVYISHPDPKMAARIANAIADVAPDEIANFVEGSSTKIIDYAKVPAHYYTPNYQKNALTGGVVGCLLAGAYVFLCHLLDVRVKNEEDLAALFDLPLLGQIPNFDESNKNKDARYAYVQSEKEGQQ